MPPFRAVDSSAAEPAPVVVSAIAAIATAEMSRPHRLHLALLGRTCPSLRRSGPENQTGRPRLGWARLTFGAPGALLAGRALGAVAGLMVYADQAKKMITLDPR
jgi:hypothetical protein